MLYIGVFGEETACSGGSVISSAGISIGYRGEVAAGDKATASRPAISL